MQNKEMTRKEWGKEIVRNIISLTITVIGALIILSFTNLSEDKEKTKEELIRLDKEKASIIYVDQKCMEVKEDTGKRLDKIEETTQKIYDYLLNQKK